MAGEKGNEITILPDVDGGSDPETKHPCAGCLHYYGAYEYNRCCNYIFDMGHPRPCPPGKDCTAKRPVTSKTELKLRKIGLY